MHLHVDEWLFAKCFIDVFYMLDVGSHSSKMLPKAVLLGLTASQYFKSHAMLFEKGFGQMTFLISHSNS